MADLRKLPKVDTLAQSPALSSYPEGLRVQAAREAIAQIRVGMLAGTIQSAEHAEDLALSIAKQKSGTSLQRVINASGVILHTGLGRARLAEEAVKALETVAKHHARVEFELESGDRGDRQDHVREMLVELTGAADALVVNNCASALFLTLNALCAGRGVFLSRGQMVEIGGSFRMPDIVRQSGCYLLEVGCTNKTRIADYVSEADVAAILRCHPSNFRMVGFVSEPTTSELSAHAHEMGWMMIDDVGSGTLFDTTQYGLPKEPTLQESIKAGADVVLSSADKMLGGPQAGLILGSAEAIKKIKSHPLARAVRVDKLTLAALEATLRLYVQGRQNEIPTIRYLARDLASIKRDAFTLKRAYGGGAVVESGLTEVGGGSAPGVGVTTWRVGLKSSSASELSKRLRLSDPSILGRIERDLVWLDPRTMDPTDVRDAAKVLRGIE